MRIDTFSTSATLLAAALLLAACADDTADPGSSQPACLALAHTAEVDWQAAAEIGGDGALLSAWGTGPCDVYTVGGQPGAGVAYHFDGTDWTALELPTVPLLNWAFGVGDTVWIVGNGGTVLRGSATAGFERGHDGAVGQFGIAYRWDGTRWTALSTGTGEDLISLWGRSAEDITIIERLAPPAPRGDFPAGRAVFETIGCDGLPPPEPGGRERPGSALQRPPAARRRT